MAFQTYRLSVQGLLFGQTVVSVFHYAKPDGDPDDLAAELVDAWNSQLWAEYMHCVAGDYSAYSISAKLVGGVNYAEVPVSGSGGRTGSVAAPQTSATITWSTAFAERSARGRTFFPALSISDHDNGLLSTELLNVLGTFATFMLGDLVTASSTFFFSVHSYVYGTTRHILSYRANPIVRTQRRRELGVGA